MEIKRIGVLLIFSILIIAGFMFYLLVYQQARLQGQAILNETNNETGPGSCLVHQGFTWNDSEQACVRAWVPFGVVGRYQQFFNLTGSGNFTITNQTMINWTTNFNVTTINSTKVNKTNSTPSNYSANGTLNNLVNWSKLFS